MRPTRRCTALAMGGAAILAASLAMGRPARAATAPSEPDVVEAEVPPEDPPEDPEGAVISALQRQGDLRFGQDDYAGARSAWLDALSRVPPGAAEASYRVSLIALIVNATVAEFAVVGDAAPIAATLELVETERDRPGLAPELAEILDESSARLRPLVAPARFDPPPRVQGDVALDAGVVRPLGPDPYRTMVLAGSIAIGGGVAAIAAGAAFKPRALRQVEDAGDTTDDALPFINGEIRKGQAWIGVGAGLAAAGIATLVVGLVARSRRGRGAHLGWAAARGALAVVVRNRF